MLIALQATIHHSDIAVATSAFVFICLLGATLGIALGGTVFQSQMTKLSGGLPDIPGLSQITGQNAGAAVVAIQALPADVKSHVVASYVESMRMIWIVLSAFAASGFIGSFAIGKHELHTESGFLEILAHYRILTNQPALMKKKPTPDGQDLRCNESKVSNNIQPV